MRSFSTARGVLVALGSMWVAFSAFASAGCGESKGGAAAPPEVAGSPAPGAAAAASSSVGELKNVLRWKTKWETLNKGFLVFRGDSEKGPFRQLTPQPLPGAGSANEVHEYSYEDATIEAGREYFYYVVAINHNNEQVRVTPVQRAAPK